MVSAARQTPPEDGRPHRPGAGPPGSWHGGTPGGTAPLKKASHPGETAGSSSEGPAWDGHGHRLAGLAFLDGLPDWVVRGLARDATETYLPKGAVVVRQNDEANAVYFLLDGAVEVLVTFQGVGEVPMAAQTSPGALLGWSAFCAPHRYTDSVRCREASRFVRVPRQAFEAVFAADPAVGHRILRRVATIVDARLDDAVSLLGHARDTPSAGTPSSATPSGPTSPGARPGRRHGAGGHVGADGVTT